MRSRLAKLSNQTIHSQPSQRIAFKMGYESTALRASVRSSVGTCCDLHVKKLMKVGTGDIGEDSSAVFTSHLVDSNYISRSSVGVYGVP